MSDETLFYIFGVGLAVSALVISFVGLKVKRFPAKGVPIVVLWFAVFAVAASTYVVKHSRHEQEVRAAETEAANEEIEAEEEDVEAVDGGGEEGGEAGSGEKGGGATSSVDFETPEGSELAYTSTTASAEAGDVTINFTNVQEIPHDVAIEDEAGEQVAATEVIAEGSDSTDAELSPATYTFYCTIPGHREAGMEGTLTVE